MIYQYSIYCAECDKLIAFTYSSEPLPSLYCPECEEEKEEEEEEQNGL